MGREALPGTDPLELPPLPEEKILADHKRASTELAEIDQQYGDIVAYHLDRVIQETRFLLNHSAEAMLQAGRRLIQIKEHEPTGEYLEALNKIGIDRFAASKLIRAALKFSNVRSDAHWTSLGKTKLIELAVLDDGEIEELGEGGTVRGLKLDEVECMSVRELREALRKKDKSIADLKENYEQQGKLIAGKDAKINELIVANSKKPICEDAEDTLSAYVTDLQTEALQIAARVQTSLVARINATVDAHGPERAEHARLLVAQALGQIVSAARVVAREYDLAPAEDAESLFGEAAGDDEKEIWAKIEAALGQNDKG